MRSRSWNSALTLAVLLVAIRSQALHAGSKRPAARAPEATVAKWDADATNESVQGARDVAVDRAKERVVFFLNHQHPPLDWSGRDDYVDKHIRDGSWVKNQLEEDVEAQGHDYKKVSLLVGLTSTDYEAMVRLDREARAQKRQVVLAKGLGGLVLLLTILTGLFRLNGATKKNGSASVRVAVVGLLGMLIAGGWLLA
jgi:hypothetical protein